MPAKSDPWAGEVRPLLTAALQDSAAEARLAAWLMERSGLPGPRLNLALVGAFADVVGTVAGEAEAVDLVALLDRWAAIPAAGASDNSPAIMRPACAVLAWGQWAVGRPAAWDGMLARLHMVAADSRWRVRELVAAALQRILAADWDRTLAALRGWLDTADPLVVRAVVAAVAEPPLLKTTERGAQALEIQQTATAWYLALPAATRKSDAGMALRKALAYTWSVAVAAAPGPGFAALAQVAAGGDADAAWIVRENCKKNRLARWPAQVAALAGAPAVNE
jgi:hypothetical protein